MKPSIYIETSVFSYLSSRTSRDIILAAHQEITREWWEQHRNDFDLFSSDVVLEEIRLGDANPTEKRLLYAEQTQLLELNDASRRLAHHFIEKGPLPTTAVNDAFHIALATVYKMEYLLTWNCRHIANPMMQKLFEKLCAIYGYEKPVICTPQELLGESI